MKFSIKSLLLLMAIVAVFFGAIMYVRELDRIRTENIRLAGEFVDTHGQWVHTMAGDYWDLAGITDLTVEELALLQYIDSYDRKRILSINLSGTNVTDEHIEFIASLPGIEELDLRGTSVTKLGVQKIENFPRYQEPNIKYDRLENFGE